MHKKVLDGFLFTFLTLCCLACLLFSKQLFSGISSGISICLNTLIPSLFGFMVLSKFITDSPLGELLGKPFSFLTKPLFRLDSNLFSIFLLSLLGGYPVGPRLLSEQVKEGRISQSTAQRILPFCVNCSPAFLISGVSLPLWNTVLPGVILFSAQTLSCMVIAFLTGRRKSVPAPAPVQNRQKPDWAFLFVDSVNGSVRSMAAVCGFVVLFCGLFSFLDLLPLSGQTASLWKGFLEVTSGCQTVSGSFIAELYAVCLFTSFGGICVHLQTMALLSGSGLKLLPCLLWRIPHVLFSLLFTYLGVLILNPVSHCINQGEGISYRVWSVSPLSSFLLLLLGILLLLFYAKPVTIK